MSYDNFATTFSNSRKNLHWPELEYIIADLKAQNYSSILDIGCGNGRFLAESAKLGYIPREYLGTDNSLGMIREAQKLHTEYLFKVYSMEQLGENITGKYDALIFLASFHHLENKDARILTLESIKKFLNPNGRIYMTNWNLREQPKYENNHRGNGDFDIKIGEFARFYHGFTVSELEKLFTKAGYCIIENRIFDGGKNIVSIIESIK